MNAFQKATLLKLFSIDNSNAQAGLKHHPSHRPHGNNKSSSNTATHSPNSAVHELTSATTADNQIAVPKEGTKRKSSKNSADSAKKSAVKENLPQKVDNTTQTKSQNSLKIDVKTSTPSTTTNDMKKGKRKKRKSKKAASTTNELNGSAVSTSSATNNSSVEKSNAEIVDSTNPSQAGKTPKKRKRKRKNSNSAGNDLEVSKGDSITKTPDYPSPPKQRKVDLDVSKKEVKGKQTDVVGKKSGKQKGKDKNQERKERLESARFRFLNQMLYTSHSQEAVDEFKSDPSSFNVYHQGYRRQIEKWPVKPIDLAIKYVKSRPRGDVIADLGCGEAKLATVVPQKVHSFDLKALNARVTVADMSKLPLGNGSVNVVVYCLSLMGTNLTDFLKEAHRVLIDGGVVWIAEVSSRFDGDIKAFSDGVEAIGFKCTGCDTTLSHFVTLTFKKTKAVVTAGKKSKAARVDISLAPCLYKKR